MSADPVISVQQVSKAYRIWDTPADRLGSQLWETAAGFLPAAGARDWAQRRATALYRDFWALRDVTFAMQPGESVGIIGRNGSGKSTLLQIIAGTLRPTRGEVHVRGRVAALLELGSGFNPDFTGRENVYLNGAVLGLTRREVDERFDRIAAFADIGDFIDQPVKTYSSGMFVRLAFAVQTAVEPQVLIVDEALSVGDVFFQQRCYARMRQLLDQGVCIVLATHDMGAVQQFCARTLVFRSGRLAFAGPSAEATKTYFQLEQQDKAATYAAQREPTPAAALPADTQPIAGWPGPGAELPTAGAKLVGNGWARCTYLAIGRPDGSPCLHFRQGETMSVFYEFEALHDLEFAFGCVTLRDKTNQPVHSKITLQDGIRGPARVPRGTRLRFRQDTELLVACVDYTVDIALEMIAARLLDQPGISYDEFMAAQLRICELHAAAAVTVRLRDGTTPFQLLHFGTAGLPSRSAVQVLPPAP